MNKGLPLPRRAAAGLLVAGAAASVAFLLACASAPQQDPGLYNLVAWNYWNGDANGEVGHRIYVKGPTAKCVPGNSWSSDARINSGRLPPGLSFDDGYNISGIPTERGHWIVALELYNVVCNNTYYRGLTQELRFHITGTGRVVE